MLAALIGILVIIATFLYNLRRVYLLINKDYGSRYIAGWVIAPHIMMSSLVAVIIAYLTFGWGEQTAPRAALMWMGLAFVPIVLGTILRIIKDGRDEKHAASLYADNEY